MDINSLSAPLNKTYGKNEGASPAQTAPGQNAGADAGVALSLSQTSELLNKGTPLSPEWGSKFKTTPPIPRTVTELHEFVSQYIDEVRQHINDLFGEAGVQLQDEVQLQFHPDRPGYTVQTGTAQAGSVISALQSDPQLQQQLQHLQQRHDLSQLLDAAQTLRQGGDMAANTAQFQAQRDQQAALSLVIPAQPKAE